jgi:hypothetical protein
METRSLRFLAIGLLLAGLLAGCAMTAGREDLGGLPNAEQPDYMVHPLRLIALPLTLAGNILQYTLEEPAYFLLLPVPEAVGLSLEEQRYLAQRQEAWRQYFAAERKLVQ